MLHSTLLIDLDFLQFYIYYIDVRLYLYNDHDYVNTEANTTENIILLFSTVITYWIVNTQIMFLCTAIMTIVFNVIFIFVLIPNLITYMTKRYS